MSKRFTEELFKRIKEQKGLPKKLFADIPNGNRLFPPKSKDAQFEVRFDAGHLENGHRHIHLQVNSQAESIQLKNFIKEQKKKGTHADLATATLDIEADDQEKEGARFLEELREQVEKNLVG